MDWIDATGLWGPSARAQMAAASGSESHRSIMAPHASADGQVDVSENWSVTGPPRMARHRSTRVAPNPVSRAADSRCSWSASSRWPGRTRRLTLWAQLAMGASLGLGGSLPPSVNPRIPDRRVTRPTGLGHRAHERPPVGSAASPDGDESPVPCARRAARRGRRRRGGGACGRRPRSPGRVTRSRWCGLRRPCGRGRVWLTARIGVAGQEGVGRVPSAPSPIARCGWTSTRVSSTPKQAPATVARRCRRGRRAVGDGDVPVHRHRGVDPPVGGAPRRDAGGAGRARRDRPSDVGSARRVSCSRRGGTGSGWRSGGR